jgi:hypothetical protein
MTTGMMQEIAHKINCIVASSKGLKAFVHHQCADHAFSDAEIRHIKTPGFDTIYCIRQKKIYYMLTIVAICSIFPEVRNPGYIRVRII